MRSLIIASTVLFVALGGAASAKSEKGCRAKGTCEPGIMQVCAAQWKEKKANPTDTNVETIKAGWMKFWPECANAAKVARTVAP